MSLLEQELKQTRPIDDPAVEAVLSVLKTADLARRELDAAIAPYGITQQQYNVLRILQGAGKAGIPTLDIAERMIEGSPNVTRLLDRLEAKGYAGRTRSSIDRRVVYATITPAGAALLDEMKPAMYSFHRQICAGLTQSEMGQLARLLEKWRRGVYQRQDDPSVAAGGR